MPAATSITPEIRVMWGSSLRIRAATLVRAMARLRVKKMITEPMPAA